MKRRGTAKVVHKDAIGIMGVVDARADIFEVSEGRFAIRFLIHASEEVEPYTSGERGWKPEDCGLVHLAGLHAIATVSNATRLCLGVTYNVPVADSGVFDDDIYDNEITVVGIEVPVAVPEPNCAPVFLTFLLCGIISQRVRRRSLAN